jgi:transmembrane sensor
MLLDWPPYAAISKSTNRCTVLAWSRSQLVFKNRPLSEVVAAIDRYYPGAIVLTNSASGAKRVNATVNLGDIDEWLATMGRSQ